MTLKDLMGVEMGSIRQYRPGRWRISFYWNGRKFDIYRMKDGEFMESEREAVRTLADIEGQIQRREFDPAQWEKDRPFLWEKAVKLWIDLKPVSMETLDSRERIVEKFLNPWFTGKDIREIRRIHIDELHNHLKRKLKLGDKYIYNILGELRACLRFHKESIPHIPEFPKIKWQERPIRWLTPEQQDQVFEFIPEPDLPIYTFQRWTAVRPNEARGLTWENVQRDKGIILIATVIDSHGAFIERNKTNTLRVLPVIPEIEWILSPKVRHMKFVFTHKGAPYGKRTHESLWKKANLKANERYGTPIVSMYPGTKHSFGMQRLNSGFSMDSIRSIMGHKDRQSTERYAKYLNNTLADVMSGRAKVIPMKKAQNSMDVVDGPVSTEKD